MAAALALAVAGIAPTGAHAAPAIPERLPVPYAVMVFENRSGVQGLEWMRLATPLLLGEKLEAHRGLRPVYGPLVVPDGAPPPVTDAAAVAALAAASGASWVWTGWIKRPSWELELAITLWRVDAGQAAPIGEVVRRGTFAEVHRFTAEAAAELCKRAGAPIDRADAAALERVPTADFYALTLFGRGLAALHGAGAAPDLVVAAKNLSRAMFIDPKLAEAHRVMAELHLRRKQPAKARGQLGYALDLKPGYYAALVALARLSHDDDKLDAARELYEQALAQRPWDREPRFALGRLLWETGDLDGSLRELTRLVEVAPDHLAARRVLVLIHASKGAGTDLVRELEAIVGLAPEDGEARLDLGAAYAAVGRADDAIATYEALVERDRRQLQALKFLGDLYRRRGELKQAIRWYEQALAANRNDPRPYFLLGEAYVEAGDDHAAKRIYRKAQRFPQYLPETYNNLGAIAFREHRLAESLWYLRRAVGKRADNPRFRYNLALSLSARNEVDEALGHVDAALALSPDRAELHYLRGVILLRKGNADGALIGFARALELDPEHADARQNFDLLEEMRRRADQGEIVIEAPR